MVEAIKGSPLRELGEKIDGLNRIPLNPSVIIAISLASFFTYYDVSNYAYISPVLRTAWGVSDTQIAVGASFTIVGYVIGALLITLLADSQGRRTAFVISILLLGAGSILAAAAQNMTELVLFRLVTGAGIGSELAIASVYIGEMSPKSKRGKYTSLLSVLGWVGLTSSGPISLSFVQGQFASIEGWRIVLGIAGAVALASLPFRVRMPESPRWLLSKGRPDEANETLRSIGVAPMQMSMPTEAKASSFYLLKSRPVVLRILLMVGVWFLVYIPIYSSLLLVIEYVNQGYTISQSISINLLSGIGFVAGGAVAILLADRMERKYQIAIASFALGLGYLLRGLLVSDFAGLVFAGFIAFFANAWVVTALLAYTAENFPTRIRSSAAGIVEGSSRGIAATSPFIFLLFDAYGFLATMVSIATFAFVAAGVTIAFGRRTKGQSLEVLANDST